MGTPKEATLRLPLLGKNIKNGVEKWEESHIKVHPL